MLINNVVIENFRCYYGKNEISFNKDGKITLIYGDSGFGKSSFLQFFRWMFYDNPDFGSNNDKPLFNLSAFKECGLGNKFRVYGQINFEHMGVTYSLVKSTVYKASLLPENTFPTIGENEYSLKLLEDGNWVVYKGDVANKINSILPKGLSKYFLLDGEKARDIVLNARDLKIAIHTLFGIDAYANALSHLGNKNKKSSVLGFYYEQMASKMTTTLNGMTAAELQETIQELYDEIETMKEQRHEKMAEIENKNNRKDEILKIIGEANNRSSLQQLIKMNEMAIADNEKKIAETRAKIGDLFYNFYPYLFLAKIASKNSTLLREKNLSFAQSYKNIYEHLHKPLLKEILEKGVCICGKPLDNESTKRINGIMGVMPPDSYDYQFGQFVSKAKNKIQASNIKIMEYDSYIAEISSYQNAITELSDSNREKLEDLKHLEDAKNLVEELENIKVELEKLGREKAGFEGTISRKKQTYELSNRQLESIMKNNKVSQEYSDKIDFFTKLKEEMEQEKIDMEKKVEITLNNCVRDIFKKLTTQTELNADNIQFVNSDFSLRTTFLTGGQLAVDEYSYVIGIIKALQACNMENNENPIIIDAPFAFTGNTQSEHIFKTLPSVAKQTVLLTLDLNKIKNLLGEKDLYDFYVIKNETQEKAKIERGNINDIKF